MRQFETNYAGMWSGYCKTRESAIMAAVGRVVNDGYSKCTITDRYTGEVVARVTLNKFRTSASVQVIEPFKKGRS